MSADTMFADLETMVAETRPRRRLDLEPDLAGMPMPDLPAGSLPFAGRMDKPAPIGAPPRPKRVSLLEKYRPRTLADLVGQPGPVRVLERIAADPFPCGLCLHGGTGLGKSAAAAAFAVRLGCAVQYGPVGGYHLVRSSEQSIDALRALVDEVLIYYPMQGSGWRVVQVEEADRMSAAVETYWLSVLDTDNLPPRTIFIFTTNEPAKLSARFRSRCTMLEFLGGLQAAGAAAITLAARVWKAEGLDGPCPSLSELGAMVDGAVSYRAVIQGIQTAALSR